MATSDLLNPSNLKEHYLHLLRQTISAYDPTQIALGEVLQNAIDAIVEVNDGAPHEINIKLDLDQSAVTIYDNGKGFPNDPSLLFLGGGTKRSGNRKLFGLVGVGIKVVLFSSQEFCLRAKSDDGAFRYEISNTYKFEDETPPNLPISEEQFSNDPKPLNVGTEVHYRFPGRISENCIGQFLQNMYEKCLPQGNDSGFGKTLNLAKGQGDYVNRFSGLLATYLRRYTYASDVLNRLNEKPELSNTTIRIDVICSNPIQDFGEKIGDLFDGITEFSFEINPEYLLVSDTSNWVKPGDHVGLFNLHLGWGGKDLPRTSRGFNTLVFKNQEEYERLLKGVNGNISSQIEKSLQEYRDNLFPKINGIYLTIGRIPHFDEFLPGGSQRVISANGIVTSHSVDPTRGRNQQYVRCFDLVVDVNAKLNYGKSQLTDKHLINRINRFINDAYTATIYGASRNWVGTIEPPNGDDEQYDVFLGRESLNVPGLVNMKVPTGENDVIALFFELLSRGYIEGYQSFGLSQKATYDGKFLIRRSGDEDFIKPTDDKQLSDIEFKHTASSIIRDFEQEIKYPRDLKLVIAWKEGSSNSNQFHFVDIEHGIHYAQEKVFPKVTRYLKDTRSGSEIQILLLKTVIDNIRQNTENLIEK